MLTGVKVIHLCEEVAGDKSTGALLMKELLSLSFSIHFSVYVYIGLCIEKRRYLMSNIYVYNNNSYKHEWIVVKSRVFMPGRASDLSVSV